MIESTKRALTVPCEIHGVPIGTYCILGPPYVCSDRRSRFYIDSGEPKPLSQRRKESKLVGKRMGKK